jgi:hypothetical protein
MQRSEIRHQLVEYLFCSFLIRSWLLEEHSMNSDEETQESPENTRERIVEHMVDESFVEIERPSEQSSVFDFKKHEENATRNDQRLSCIIYSSVFTLVDIGLLSWNISMFRNGSIVWLIISSIILGFFSFRILLLPYINVFIKDFKRGVTKYSQKSRGNLTCHC